MADFSGGGTRRPEESAQPRFRVEAGSAVHDFGNLLQSAVSALRVAQRRLGGEDAEDAATLLCDATAALERAGAIANGLLRTGPVQGASEPVAVNRLILEFRPVLRHVLGGAIRLDKLVAGSLPALLCDPAGPENVLLNLAVSARDALPRGGRVVVEARECHAHEAAPRRCVTLSVTDDGCGMSADVAAQAFRRFFTTKGSRGTGLGLAGARAFAEALGGSIELRTGPGQGTAVRLHLPGPPARPCFNHTGEVS